MRHRILRVFKALARATGISIISAAFFSSFSLLHYSPITLFSNSTAFATTLNGYPANRRTIHPKP
jgi:hypothetical protein